MPSNEIVPLERPAATPMELLSRAVERGMDPQQLSQLMDLQERYDRNQAAKLFAEALAAFQAKCPPIHKGRGVSLSGGSKADYMYASLDDIMHVIAPILAACGLSVSFSAVMTDKGMLTADCSVRCGTHAEKSSVTLPVPASMRVNETQKMGAALSYAKRYALCAALNISVTNEDTDAKGLNVQRITEQQATELQGMAESCGANRESFLATFGIKTLADLPDSCYTPAFNMLKAKCDKKGGAK